MFLRILLLPFCFLLMAHISLKAEYFYITTYDVKINIAQNGTYKVIETIDVVFNEPRRGIFRKIPRKYKIDGKNYKLKIADVEVKSFEKHVENEGKYLNIRIGSEDIFVEGSQRYIIQYTIENGILYDKEHAELQWNIIGPEWEVPIQKVHFNISFNENVNFGEGDVKLFAGESGSQQNEASFLVYENYIDGVTNRTLQPSEGVSIFMKLPYSYIRKPGPYEQWWHLYGMLALGVLIFVVSFILLYRFWHIYGRDYPFVKMVQYLPPKQLTPSEAGMLLDETADNRDILCLLPYWAQHGVISIEVTDDSVFSKDYELKRLKSLPENATLYEKIIFDGIFENGDQTLVSDLENKFYQKMQSAKSALKEALHQKKVYYPNSIKYQLIMGIISVVFVLAGIAFIFMLDLIEIGLALALSGITGIFFARYMLKKNEHGVQLYQEALGFKMFVKAAEKNRLEKLLAEDPMYFEKTLPYAIAFGFARKWSEKFEGLVTEPPSWYTYRSGLHHAGHFSAGEFGASMQSSVTHISSAFSSVPSGSGGSGSGGGGSVGGGFGGGGGGSW